MDIYLTRTAGSTLTAYDDDARSVLRRIKIGTMVRANIARPRNLMFHRKFFGMCKFVYDSCGDWTDLEELVRELKFRVGHVDKQRIVDRQTGEVIAELVIPKSINFATMGQMEFEQFVERCIHVICRDLVPGIEDDVLRQEVLRKVA